ncbi:MAG: DUF427 domain-containing protein [Dokdonella sp.]
MKAVWNGAVLAQSDATVVVDGNHYFPADSIASAHFEPTAHSSLCGWKGTATYFSINVDGKRNENAAWCYADPKPAAAEIRGRIAFWKGVVVSP